MKRVLLSCISSVCFFCISEASGNLFELTVQEDSFICSDDYAEMNFGDYEYTRRAVGRQNAYTGLQIGRSLYKFQSPDNLVSVQSATLRIKVWDNFAGYPMTVGVCGAEDNWNEATVTWDSQPTHIQEMLDTATVTQISGLNRDIIIEFDVTDFVSDQITNGDDLFSFVLKSTNEDVVGGVRWFMRESVSGWFGTPGMAPELVLVIPEPATLSLLAFGGLTLRRKRK